MFCITKYLTEKFLEKLKSGEITPEKLMSMTSEERRAYFETDFGKENAVQINRLLESKVILKDQQAGMIRWAKQLTGLKPQAKRDILSRIEKMTEILTPENQDAFLEDLVAHKLGVSVTMEEAGNIAAMSKIVTEMRDARDTGGDRMDYGRAKEKLLTYVSELKTEAKKMSVSEYLTSPVKTISEIAGTAKAMKASLDNSAIGRQGIKILWTNPEIWAKNSAKTFLDIWNTFGGKDTMSEIRADALSRPNYEKYVKDKLAIGITEEAFPTHWPAKIPGLGKLFKASEAAYSGFMLRNRIDLYDKYTDIAQKSGLGETTNLGIGKLVNSLTSRGDLGRFEPVASTVNNVFFSPRNLKANIDVLTAHVFDKNMSPFVRKQAAINLVKIISGTAAVLVLADAMIPGSVEKDPRSPDFGKIRVGDTRFDITGGMASIVILAARLINGNTKSSVTGEVISLTTGHYGRPTRLDQVYNFFQNKLSPAYAVVKDILKGKDFQGNPITIQGEISNLLMPLPIATFEELKNNPNSANIILAMILEELGVSTNTYSGKQEGNSIKSKQEKL
jgi:hypothetical protein